MWVIESPRGHAGERTARARRRARVTNWSLKSHPPLGTSTKGPTLVRAAPSEAFCGRSRSASLCCSMTKRAIPGGALRHRCERLWLSGRRGRLRSGQVTDCGRLFARSLRSRSSAEIDEWLIDRCVEEAGKRLHPTVQGKTVWQALEKERPKWRDGGMGGALRQNWAGPGAETPRARGLPDQAPCHARPDLI